MKAVIDIGSNSARSLWRLTEDDPGTQSIRYTRLGEDLDGSGTITEEGLARTQEAILCLLQDIPDLILESCSLYATSAFREASNGGEALEELAASIGRPITLLTEGQEAYYGYLGASHSFQGRSLAVLDIGGGSTELSWDYERFVSHSVPIGCLRLLHQGLDKESLKEKLLPLLDGYPLGRDVHVVVIGGTATSLAAMDKALVAYDTRKIHGTRLFMGELEHMVKDLSAMSLEDLRKVPGLAPARADIILPGADILLAMGDLLQCQTMTVSTEDILHGLIRIDTPPLNL